jgi:hypothetical protein
MLGLNEIEDKIFRDGMRDIVNWLEELDDYDTGVGLFDELPNEKKLEVFESLFYVPLDGKGGFNLRGIIEEGGKFVENDRAEDETYREYQLAAIKAVLLNFKGLVDVEIDEERMSLDKGEPVSYECRDLVFATIFQHYKGSLLIHLMKLLSKSAGKKVVQYIFSSLDGTSLKVEDALDVVFSSKKIVNNEYNQMAVKHILTWAHESIFAQKIEIIKELEGSDVMDEIINSDFIATLGSYLYEFDISHCKPSKIKNIQRLYEIIDPNYAETVEGLMQEMLHDYCSDDDPMLDGRSERLHALLDHNESLRAFMRWK